MWDSGLPRNVTVRRRQQGLRNQRDQQSEQSSASSSSCSSSSTSRSSSADTVAEIEVVVPVIAEEEKNGDADHSDGEDSHAPQFVPRKLKVAQVSPFMVEKVKKIMTSYKTTKPLDWRLKPVFPLKRGQPLDATRFYAKEIILWDPLCYLQPHLLSCIPCPFDDKSEAHDTCSWGWSDSIRPFVDMDKTGVGVTCGMVSHCAALGGVV